MALGPEGFPGEKEGKEKELKLRENCEFGEKHYIPHTFLCPFFAQSCMQKINSLKIS